MGYIFYQEQSPSPLVSLNSFSTALLKKQTSVFIFFENIKKIYGPLILQKGKIVFSNRRGLPVSEDFYIPLHKGKTTKITSQQEQLLLQDLYKINQPQLTPNILHLSLNKKILTLSLTNTYPTFFVYKTKCKIDLKTIQSLSQNIQDTLRQGNQEIYSQQLKSLQLYGQSLFRKIFKDKFFSKYFETHKDFYLSFHLSSSLFFVPFEFLFNNYFLFLNSPFSRLMTQTPSSPIAYKYSSFGFFSFKNQTFIKENQNIQKLFTKKNKPSSLYVFNKKSQYKILKEHKWVHFTGHSINSKSSFVWKEKKSKIFLSDYEFLPEFIFSNSCNADFFSKNSYENFFKLFHSNLLAWLGSLVPILKEESSFAYLFYSNLLKKQTIARALLNTKQFFYENNNPLWMQYALLGNPLLKLDYDK